MMIPLDNLLSIRFEFGPNCNLYSWPILFNCTFSLSRCGGIKDKVDSFLLQGHLTSRKFDMLMYPVFSS